MFIPHCQRLCVFSPWRFVSPKSKLFQYLKGLVQSDSLPNVDTKIADGMFLTRSTRRCCTYRLFVQTVLKTAWKQTVYRGDICFDIYESPSLKDRKIVKDRKWMKTNPNVSFPLDHNKRCQLISKNYWNYPALRKNYLDFSLSKLNIQSMFQ